MSKTCRTIAMLMKSDASAKYLPGQTLRQRKLGVEHASSTRPETEGKRVRMPTFARIRIRTLRGRRRPNSACHLAETSRAGSALGPGIAQDRADTPCISSRSAGCPNQGGEWCVLLPRVRQQDSPCRDKVPIALRVRTRHVWYAEGQHRSPAQDFFGDRVDVRKVGFVAVLGQAVRAYDRVELGLCPPLHVWMERHSNEER